MRRLTLVLIASLRLCRARHPSFSIHDDLLAHPQFEVVFSDTYISQGDALDLLDKSRTAPNPARGPDASAQSDLTSKAQASSAAESGNGGEASDAQIAETYELIHVPPLNYLCAVPVLAPPPAFNRTETEMAKTEEALELRRALAKGWELMGGLEGQCLYFVSGWWSYQFCYGMEIVQFHALPGHRGMLPVKDPHTQEYVLGRTSTEKSDGAKALTGQQKQNKELQGQKPTTADGETTAVTPPTQPPNTAIQHKGDQRYLVQRLAGGTTCDLTGRDRTIEVQYHCAPGPMPDRIGWIKEVTTCKYLMVVYTPRLCADVAFLPPKETHAHAISCRQIVSGDDEAASWQRRKSIEAHEPMEARPGREEQDQGQGRRKARKSHESQHDGVTIGGVVVGGRQVLGSGDDGLVTNLPPPKHLSAARLGGVNLVDILARVRSKAKDGDMEAMTDEELRKVESDPEKLERLRDELRKLTGDKAWKPDAAEGSADADESKDEKGRGERSDRQKSSHGDGERVRGSRDKEDGSDKAGATEREPSRGTFRDYRDYEDYWDYWDKEREREYREYRDSRERRDKRGDGDRKHGLPARPPKQRQEDDETVSDKVKAVKKDVAKSNGTPDRALDKAEQAEGHEEEEGSEEVFKDEL